MRPYDRKRKKADLDYPIRLLFDGPLPRLAEMHQMADAAFALNHPPIHRAAFYFASIERFTAFVEIFGPGRPMGEGEGIAKAAPAEAPVAPTARRIS